jgi:hypothetical protein
MIYNPNISGNAQMARAKLDYLIEKGKVFELTEKKGNRSGLQNKALHLFFTIISEQLNEMGLEFHYFGLKGQELTTRYTPHVVKEFFWRPIQIALFDIKSTTKISTTHINEITDVIVKFFGERGVVIDFPSVESLMYNNSK